MKTFYPCTIKKEEGVYYVNFLDFADCFTDGDTMEEAILNAKDVLEAVAFSYLKNNKPLPEPSFPEGISDMVYIDLWLDLLRDKVNNQSIKKTLTIPKWLNDLAEEQSANFSAILQLGLKEYLGIK
ncbi:MAG: type II toxin-antitoxin system HicB family antitoxin [Eubacteriales bacterium]|nr:type II toxin-antitoxin system HicB family antitoxin [Eubacteriales bacterium]